LLATVPYLLLSGAQQVAIKTTVFPTGSGYRLLTVDANADRQQDVSRYAEDAQKLANISRVEKTQGGVHLVRDYWAPSVERLPDTKLTVSSLLPKPWDLFTEYDWSETLKFYAENATEVEWAGAAQAGLTYTLNMPGTVAQESVSPTATVEGGQVTWKLTADKPEYELKATSYQLRWGYLAFLIYLLACVIVFGGRSLGRLIANRPRKI
jgi:hypothetical protein